jgi:hypothetical protein
MSGHLDRRDRQLLIGAGLLLIILVVVAALVGPAHVTGAESLPSSYSPAWEGTKGAYLLLGQLGYRVERWEKSAAEIPEPAGNTVLVLADPTIPPTSEDRIAIRHFLESGGRVLATGPTAASFLPDATPFPRVAPWKKPKTFAPLIPSPLARGVGQISLMSAKAWHPATPSHVVVFGDKQTAAVVSWPFGRGQVIWWAAVTPLTNGGIRDADNLGLLLNSLGPAGTKVLWDEYVHGVRASLWSFFAPTPVPWILLQFGLVFLALLFTFSRRLGPARMPAVASRLSPLEFVETLGDLYYTAHAGSAAVGIAYGRLRFLLARQLGLPQGAGAREISRSASERLGWDESALFDTLSRAERMMRSLEVKDEDALKLVREIHDGIDRLQVAKTGAGARKETR